VPSCRQLLVADRRRAELADDDAAGVPLAASSAASVAMTVSPAPVTSKTSRARAGSWMTPLASNSVMPSSERVSSTAPTSISARSASTLARRSASPFQAPVTWASSPRLGVMTLAPA
jgi:hypothetical protein